MAICTTLLTRETSLTQVLATIKESHNAYRPLTRQPLRSQRSPRSDAPSWPRPAAVAAPQHSRLRLLGGRLGGLAARRGERDETSRGERLCAGAGGGGASERHAVGLDEAVDGGEPELELEPAGVNQKLINN